VIPDAKYLISQLALVGFGIGWTFHPSVRSTSIWSRAALALGVGTVALALESTCFSILRIRWTIPLLGLPLLCLSIFLAVLWSRRPSPPRPPFRLSRSVAIVAGLSLLAGGAYLALSLASSSATSMDYLLFWGVKGVRYAVHAGIDDEFLRDPFASHAVPEYPPLVPIMYAWGYLVAAKMPWRVVPALSVMWLMATIPILFDRSRRCVGDNASAALTAFWTVALSISLAYSYSGGNAEAPLLFFETVALVWLITEEEGESRLVPTLALCGAALTKVEGLVAVPLIALGTVVRPGAPEVRRAILKSLGLVIVPVMAVGSWFGYQWSRSLPVGYRAHGLLFEIHPEHLGGVLGAMVHSLNAGSVGLPWILPLIAVLAFPSRWRSAAPAFLLAGGLLIFFLFDYLHDQLMPVARIEWTLPRVSQPALSAWILGAGLVSLKRMASPDYEGPA
jgi:hypothetical protein